MNPQICDAIRARAVIRFDYKGGPRVAEPHCHGLSRTGKEVLRAYQTDGYSQSGDVRGWKMFEVAEMFGIEEIGDSFADSRAGYNPDDQHMTSIHCKV